MHMPSNKWMGNNFGQKNQCEDIHALISKKMSGKPKKKRKQEENKQKPSQSTTHLSRKGYYKYYCPTLYPTIY